MVAFSSGAVQSFRFKVQRPLPQLETRNSEESRCARTLPETSVLPWIPAPHTGMTKFTACALTERNPFSDIFKGAHEDHEGFGDYYLSISYFLFFASFVMKISVSILLAAKSSEKNR
jgi:hypothetical protein